MGLSLKIIGSLICISSFLSFIDPGTWWFHLPVTIALGCIVIAMGEVIDQLRKAK